MTKPKFSLLGNPNYTRLYIAGTTSELGSFITETALMLLVFKLSGDDKGYLGLTRAIFLLFLTIGGIVGGPIGALKNRRSVLIFCDLVRIPIVASLLVLKDPNAIVWMNGMIALFTGIFNPSRQAMINEIVPQKQIKQANALFGSTFATLHLIGPFVGAWVFAQTGRMHEILAFDLFTYFIGIWFLSRIIYKPKNSNPNSRSNFNKELKDGFSYLTKRLDLISMFANNIIAGFVIGILIPMLLPFVQEQLGGGQKEYGILLSLFGLGGIVGGWFSHKFSQLFSTGKIITCTIFIEPLIMGWWVLNTSLFIGYFIFFLWGVLVFTRIPSQLNHISETVPSNVLSQMFSLLDLAFVVPNISSGILLTFIANEYSTADLLTYSAVIFACLIWPRAFLKETQSLFSNDVDKVDRDNEALS
ncbi:MAG: hypothetical protein COW01_10330 [Bdellovibrionales bacterium CG12_big_fil_rev_8_21_14_0_65_38_15]|nr:MAG: hypothetical protein COW79_07175 [Bdellovibrionales bacterium CG22_combo_CG10-13_8_21_14_all_38_13]PIQ54533.1 MAG: hypothetical protein COW01_10330 [Bdellovibrionales bacterium CG12_big_fil_rev_8_21_14_0_65_38_15]PIR29914.1 MAG: hypothetical protein COV38_08175 [Bdellovibrionales bacterium CG11_big_fil_rev_8_21_14_0_20_38_13]